MIIKRIKLKNIRSYVDLDLELPIDSVLLWGDIGSGKTTILMAIAFALFGLHNDITGNTLLRHGQNKGFVILTIQIEDKEVIIERTLNRSKKSINQGKGKITINDEEYEMTPKELKANVLKLIGYPEDLLTKNKILIFQYTVYTPQEEIKKILYDDANERLQVLKNVFEIEKYQRIQDNILNFFSQLNSKSKYLKGLSKDLDEKIEQFNKLDEEREQKNKKLEEKISELENNQRLSSLKKKELNEIEDKIKQLNELKEELSGKSVQFSSIKETQENYKLLLNKTQIKIEEINKKLEQFVDVISPTELSTEELQQKISELEIEISDGEKDQGKIDSRIRDLEKIFNQKFCEVCEQEVQDYQKFEQKIDQYKQSLEELIEKLSTNKLDKKQFEKLKLELRDYTSSLEKKTILASQLEDKKRELEDIQKKYDDEIKKLKSLVKIIQNLKLELDNFKDVEETKKVIKQELDKFEFEINKISSKKAELEADIKNLDNLKASLKGEIKKKEKAKKFNDKLLQIKDWLQHLIQVLQGIEKEVMINIWNQFTNSFQQWFNLLIEDESLQVQIDNSFAPKIIQNGYETDYEQNLSGGEKTSVALAYRLALNKVINLENEQIKTKDLLILDEPTDGFSRQQLQRIRDILHSLNTKQTIIVSHEPEIESFVSHTIKIGKINHISSIL